MVSVHKDGHLGRGDHLEYIAISDEHDAKEEVIGEVTKAFQEKFGVRPKRTTACRARNGAWLAQVYPPL